MLKKIGFKEILFFVFIIISAITVMCSTSHKGTYLKIYVIDSEMMHLIPIDVYTTAKNPNDKAEFIAAKLIEGFDSNTKIRRIIPKIRNGITVKVKDETAYVNISNKVIKNHLDGRDAEKLTVYSIVNSMLEIDGINRVRFTIDGKTAKTFMGYMDMREIFTEQEMI